MNTKFIVDVHATRDHIKEVCGVSKKAHREYNYYVEEVGYTVFEEGVFDCLRLRA
jgi:hypothetical protein